MASYGKWIQSSSMPKAFSWSAGLQMVMVMCTAWQVQCTLVKPLMLFLKLLAALCLFIVKTSWARMPFPGIKHFDEDMQALSHWLAYHRYYVSLSSEVQT